MNYELTLKMEFFRYGVVATAAPGMATKDALDCQVKSFEGSVALDCLYCITAAGGSETA